VKGVGEPGDRKGHARIDEEELETCVTQNEGWRLHATDGGGQAAPLIGRAARRANSLLYSGAGPYHADRSHGNIPRECVTSAARGATAGRTR